MVHNKQHWTVRLIFSFIRQTINTAQMVSVAGNGKLFGLVLITDVESDYRSLEYCGGSTNTKTKLDVTAVASKSTIPPHQWKLSVPVPSVYVQINLQLFKQPTMMSFGTSDLPLELHHTATEAPLGRCFGSNFSIFPKSPPNRGVIGVSVFSESSHWGLQTLKVSPFCGR